MREFLAGEMRTIDAECGDSAIDMCVRSSRLRQSKESHDAGHTRRFVHCTLQDLSRIFHGCLSRSSCGACNTCKITLAFTSRFPHSIDQHSRCDVELMCCRGDERVSVRVVVDLVRAEKFCEKFVEHVGCVGGEKAETNGEVLPRSAPETRDCNECGATRFDAIGLGAGKIRRSGTPVGTQGACREGNRLGFRDVVTGNPLSIT